MPFHITFRLHLLALVSYLLLPFLNCICSFLYFQCIYLNVNWISLHATDLCHAFPSYSRFLLSCLCLLIPDLLAHFIARKTMVKFCIVRYLTKCREVFSVISTLFTCTRAVWEHYVILDKSLRHLQLKAHFCLYNVEEN